MYIKLDALSSGIYVSNNECLRWSESGVWKMCRSVFKPDKPLNRTTTSTTTAPVPVAVAPASARGVHNVTTTRAPPALICTLTEETEIYLGKFYSYPYGAQLMCSIHLDRSS